MIALPTPSCIAFSSLRRSASLTSLMALAVRFTSPFVSAACIESIAINTMTVAGVIISALIEQAVQEPSNANVSSGRRRDATAGDQPKELAAQFKEVGSEFGGEVDLRPRQQRTKTPRPSGPAPTV